MEDLNINDLIASERFVWSTAPFIDKKASYNPTETVQIEIPSGDYIFDCDEAYILFDFAVAGTTPELGAYCFQNPEDVFCIQNLMVNGTQLIQSNYSQGKGLLANFLNNNVTQYERQRQQFPINSLRAGTTTGALNVQINGADVTGNVFYDPLSQVSTNSSVLAYDVGQLHAAQFRQKQYLHTIAANGTVTVTAIANNALAPNSPFLGYIVQLSKISTEWASLGKINMCSTQLSAQLRFNENSRVLTSSMLGFDGTNNDLRLIIGDRTYSLSNLCMYYKHLAIKPNLISQAKLMMNKPKNIITTYQHIFPCQGLQNSWTINVNCSALYYALIFLQPSAASKTYNTAHVLSYASATAGQFNTMRFGTYSDSLLFRYNQLVLDINGQKFKDTNILPIANPGLKSWIDAKSAIRQCLGQELDVSLNSFLNNRFVVCVPISVNQYPSSLLINKSAVVTVSINIDASDPRGAALANDFSFFTFLIGSKVLIGDGRLE